MLEARVFPEMFVNINTRDARVCPFVVVLNNLVHSINTKKNVEKQNIEGSYLKYLVYLHLHEQS